VVRNCSKETKKKQNVPPRRGRTAAPTRLLVLVISQTLEVLFFTSQDIKRFQFSAKMIMITRQMIVKSLTNKVGELQADGTLIIIIIV
jgi:hypothetical protein